MLFYLVARLHGLMNEIPTLTHTADSLALAQRIIALIEQESQEPETSGTSTAADAKDGHQPESRPGCGMDAPGQSSSTPETPAASSTAKDEASNSQDATETGTEDSDTGEATDHTANPTTHPISNTDSDTPENTAGRTATPSSTVSVSRAMQDALQSTLGAGADQLPEDLFQTVAETLGEQSVYAPTLLPTLEHFTGHVQLGQVALNRAQALEQTRLTPRGRALSNAHLHRAGVGNPRIFRRCVITERPPIKFRRLFSNESASFLPSIWTKIESVQSIDFF